MSTTTVLDREMYSEARAARLLQLAPSTLHYWLEGGTYRGRTHKPIIREEPTGSKSVTWAEFIEAGLLRRYRRQHNIPMLQLRNFIESLRQEFGIPYPLAHERPFAEGRKLIIKAQEEADLDGDFVLVAETRHGQYILSAAAQEFYERVTWVEELPTTWRPVADLDSPVIVDPDVRFGAPSVGGISTAVLAEQAEDREAPEDLAETYNLTLAQVQWALAYQATQAA